MNLFETLQKMKSVRPDPLFSEKSRRDILMSVPQEPLLPRIVFARFVGATGSLVLAGILVFIIAGGLSTTDLAPKFSSIDPVALRAEAQAIDTQINLLNVSYTESPVSTAPTPLSTGKTRGIIILDNLSSSTAQTTASSTPTSTVSIDEVLQGLSD
jgi:hypothetical protein